MLKLNFVLWLLLFLPDLWPTQSQHWLLEDLAEQLYDYRETVIVPALEDATIGEREALVDELARVNHYIAYALKHPDDDDNACGQITLAAILRIEPGFFVIDSAPLLANPGMVTTARELKKLLLATGRDLEMVITDTNGQNPIDVLVDEIVAGRLPMVLIPLTAAGGDEANPQKSHWVWVQEITQEEITAYNSLTNSTITVPTDEFAELVRDASDGHENIFSIENPHRIQTRG